MFNQKYTYKIIDDTITTEELENHLKENNVYLDIVDNSTEWAAFSQYYGRSNGLNDVVTASFSYMVSLFMTGMGISASTEMYFREEQIEHEILDEYNNIFDHENEWDVKRLFNFIFQLYKDIHKYEYKTEKLDFRLGINEYTEFMNIPAKSKADKLRILLNHYYDEHGHSETSK